MNQNSNSQIEYLTSSHTIDNTNIIHNFYLSNKNLEKLTWVFHFCNLYIAYRDFDLAKIISKSTPMKWQQAESLSNFCNQIIKIKENKPQDFIYDDDTNINNVLDKYLVLKNCLLQLKCVLGAKNKNKLYKSVKSFYRKNVTFIK